MIRVHRLNGEEFILNANHIETVEERPDTTITMMNDRKYIEKEPAVDVIAMVEEYNLRFYRAVHGKNE